MLTLKTMKVKVFHIIAALFLMLGICPGVWAEDICPSEYETAFLDMINAARENPLAVAASMGMDPDRIILDFPEMQDILTGGLPPLDVDKNLYESARVHTEDMIEEGYYGYDSPDGRTYEDRIRETGYISVATGESLGLSGFSNFIDPAESARTIFERMFRDQLDPAGGEQWNILDPELAHAGIALGAGTLNLGGYTFNAYMISVGAWTGPGCILFNWSIRPAPGLLMWPHPSAWIRSRSSRTFPNCKIS